MITTEGFRDILHIARHKKPFNFSLQQELPWQSRPLVKRRHRLTVAERVTAPDGDVLVPLDEDEVRERVRAAPRRRRRGRRRLPAPLVPQPGARAADQGDRARGVPATRTSPSRTRCCPLPRVRALLDRLPERLRRAEGLALRGPLRRGACATRASRHGVQLMQSSGGMATVRVCDAAARQPAHVRPGRRPDRRHLGRQDGRARERRHARHRRHLGRHRRRRRRRSCACATCSTRRSATTRRWCRWSTSTRSAPAAARSPTSTRAASSASGRSRRAPTPGPACYGRGGTEPTVHRRPAPARAAAAGPRPARRRRCSSTPTRPRRRWQQIAEPLGMTVEEAALGALQSRSSA